MESVIHSDPEILSGTPVFVGTRVPAKNLASATADWIMFAIDGCAASSLSCTSCEALTSNRKRWSRGIWARKATRVVSSSSPVDQLTKVT